jgi:hypothetical protein
LPFPSVTPDVFESGCLGCASAVPSCHQERMLVTAINIAESVAVAVPHRQFVFTRVEG